MRDYFIAFDVHCEFTEVAVVNDRGELVQRDRCATTIPALTACLRRVKGNRRLTFEEGPQAGWLWRELRADVAELVVCNPRRNHLVAKDSDKDDPIDGEKLAQLFRGGYLKQVYQADELERALFKQRVGLYHDLVRQRVRTGNHVLAQFRRHGVFARTAQLTDADELARLFARLPRAAELQEDLQLLVEGFHSAVQREELMRKRLIGQARQHEPIRRFVEVPGIAWIRAATFYAYIDTPHRFRSKAALWRYVGIGLECRHSGSGPKLVRVAQQCNRRLRGTLLGAARTAIDCQDNPFYRQYLHWLEEGLSIRNARRNVARSQAAALWSMWKSGNVYRHERVNERSNWIG